MKNNCKSPVKANFGFLRVCLVPVLMGCALAGGAVAAAQAPVPDSPAIEAKAHALLSKLTLEQKIELLGGVDGMYTHAMPSIGLNV